MPRTARLQELGLPLHVMAQGIDRCRIFRDDRDRLELLRRASSVFRETNTVCLAWAFMSNHVHFNLIATEVPIGKVMQRVLGPFAQGFNRRHGRVGRLFRDRFRTRVVEDEDDLVGLIGYVLLNPLRDGPVDDVTSLARYPWTAYAELTGASRYAVSLVAATRVLALFGPNRAAALDELGRFLRRLAQEDPDGALLRRRGVVLSNRDREDLSLAGTTAMLLDSDRITAILDDRCARLSRKRRLVLTGWTLDRCVTRAVEFCRARRDVLLAGGRRRPETHARALVAHFANLCLGISDTTIARAVGTSRRSISTSRRRGAEIAEEIGMSWEQFFGWQNEMPP